MRQEARPLSLATAGLFASALLLGACRPPAEPPLLELAVRGHQEVAITPGRPAAPVFFASAGAAGEPAAVDLGLCLTAADGVDSRQWRARLWLSGEPASAWQQPAQRLANTACFRLRDAAPRAGEHHLCAELEDGYDGRRWSLPCSPLEILSAEPAARAALDARRQELMSSAMRPEGIGSLAELAHEAEAEGFPLLALQLRLMVAHFAIQEASPRSLELASEVLDRSPDWLSEPALDAWAGLLEQQRARLARYVHHDLAGAWAALGRAEERCGRVASQLTPMITKERAELLAVVGAPREAREWLERAMEACPPASCGAYHRASLEEDLAWLILLDREASPEELTEAAELLRSAEPTLKTQGQALDWGNHLGNLAWLELQRGEDPRPALLALRAELGSRGSAGERLLAGWADLVEALFLLDQGGAERPRELCSSLGHQPEFAAFAPWAFSCLGRAERLAGRPQAALAAFRRALDLHEAMDPLSRLEQRIPLGADQRAEDFYQAARAAVEAGQPAQAWELLERLDRLGCGLADEGDAAARAGLDGLPLPEPASARPGAGGEALGWAVKVRLQEIARRHLAREPRLPGEPEGYALRAFALPDEVMLLEHRAGGEVRVVARRPWRRAEMLRALERLEASPGDPSLLAAWSEALLPAQLSALPPVVPFHLHGPLQQVSLAALPLPKSPGRWLAERALPVVRGACTATAGEPGGEAQPTFLVDPAENLPSGEALASFYRKSFPASQVAYGPAATRGAFFAALDHAAILHLDAHGVYDASFPELARLELADGSIEVAELVGRRVPERLVNLSGCRTGAWPSTADSGAYGWAGQFARRGSAWVIASRCDLADPVARDFNQVLYRELGLGLSVPEAYALAHRALRERYPPALWAGLFLLSGRSHIDDEGVKRLLADSPTHKVRWESSLR